MTSRASTRITTAIFDIDGTLVDSVDLHAQCWREAFWKLGSNIEFEAIRNQIGKGGDQLIPVFWDQALIDERGKELESYRSEIFWKHYLPQVRPLPKVRDLFQRLRDTEHRIGLASSAKRKEADFYKALTDIGDLVDAEVTGDEVEYSKPCADIFAAIIEKFGEILPSEMLMVGDTPYDALGAAKAGILSLGFLSGGFPAGSLRDAGCIRIYDDPANLLDNYAQSPFQKV